MSRRQGTNRPVPVKEVLNGLLKPGDWQILQQRHLIREVWERVVPPALRAQARLLDLKRGELRVSVAASPVMQELQFLQPRLVAEIARVLGPGIVREVRFLPGPD
jgi:hypothetical protein